MTSNPVTVVIPGRPPTINGERSAHWRKHRESTRIIREDVKIQLLAKRKTWKPMGLVKVDAYPFYQKGRLPDTGACMPAVKAAIDGAVDAGLIPDDTPDIVVHMAFWSPKLDRRLLDQLLVTFEELTPDSPYLSLPRED